MGIRLKKEERREGEGSVEDCREMKEERREKRE
jgi:hypothetical protein